MPQKNILLFRGENTRTLRATVVAWREKFLEKHGEMNLLEVYRDTPNEGILSDCLTPGFMGGTRMVIFHETLQKTEKELGKIEDEKQKAVETIDIEHLEDTKKNTLYISNDALWIQTMERLPETNFMLFVGNKKPVTEFEKWLEKNATLHEFPGVMPRDMIDYVMKHLSISYDQARAFCDKLGFYEETKWGKTLTVGKPDYIYQEVEKLKLAGKTSWTNQELDEILPDYRDENAFNMLDPLWERRGKTMVEIW